MQSTMITRHLHPSYYQGEAQADAQAFALPLSICDRNLIRRQLGCPNLNDLEILSMTRDALLHGRMEADKVYINGQPCHKFVHQNMLFVLSEGFDAVVTIIWDKDTQIIGNQRSTFPEHMINTNDNKQTQSQTQTQFQSHFIPHQTPTMDADFECMLDEQCIDEIVNHLDHDMDTIDCCLYPPQYTSPPMNPVPTYRRTMSNASSSSVSSLNAFPDIKISDALYNELNTRLFGHQYQSKQDLITQIQTTIHMKKLPTRYIGNESEFCVWMDSAYVYCTLRDESTLCEIFDYTQFETHYAQCLESLVQRRMNEHYLRAKSMVSSCSTSKRSVFTDVSSVESRYHTIYVKPIIERMKANTRGSNTNVDTELILHIVDNSIKHGAKRQISKRTFEFKWQSYTIIMSKSLKTILDVTMSSDRDVITVHPDVVSIIAKKCPVLDYVTIQRLAKEAKVSAPFTTKKNDYRQQFIYDFCGCRIVFASNHTTIVEMQCNDATALNAAVCNDKY
eukprot:303499_1